MATQPSSRKARPVSETVMRMLQQADAAAVDETDPTRPTTQDALSSPELAEDYVPPPAYGDIYGEIRDERNGLGTSAHVTDDGRVNIRINQLNRRLSQVFTPALRQQVQNAQHSGPPPRPYIPPSLGGKEGVPPPPPLNVVIHIVGSRGDVQPFVALGRVLKDTYGHRVRLATHPNFKGFVQENGLEFFSIGGDPSTLMAFMVKNPGLMPGFRTLASGEVSQRRRDVAEYIQGCWRSCYEAGDGMGLRASDDDFSKPEARPFVADCIIANPPSFAHIHCAEKLGIPLHIMFTMPYSPTQAFPHPLANIRSSNADPHLTNYLSYAMIEVLTWQGLSDIINRFRTKCLGLDPVSSIWAPGMLQRLKIPHTYCWSPALIPKPEDWGSHISISGFYFLEESHYTPNPDLRAFLEAGPPPVYIGFGSIVLDDPNTMTKLVFEAVRKIGQRVLLSRGWGGIGTDELRIPDGVFMLDNVPHDWLFKQVSCVVHHGGAGTTAAGIAAGRPTVVVPFFGDQPFWGAMVARAGAGPNPIPHKTLTADKLADAITFCLKPESLERAKELASRIAAEQGCDVGAQSFHQFLEVDRLRCTLAPSRPAAWRIKRTQVRLSPFAACTLANANLLEFSDLKLFRAQEYETDEGPWDPVSGGFVAACAAFSGMAMGVAELPSETYKALQLPFGNSRQQPQASVSTTVAERELSNVGERSTSDTSPAQSQTSLNGRDSLARIRSLSKSFDLSSSTSNVGSSSETAALSDHLSPKQADANSSRFRSRNESGSGNRPDILRQTGVHTSKGFGRMMKAAFQSPMEISMGLTKGFHNVPRHWGDDTVRPQAQVSDFKSGATAAGREFGLGWYDGITGLVTQPWKGAQKEGASGLLKGFGKGIGGFATKPSAALIGVLGYTMKGVHKEVQKLYRGNVQNYVVASRTAQGYEEWLQSSDAEKQEVIDRWALIQKYLKKKKGSHEEMVRDVLEAHRTKNVENTSSLHSDGRPASPAQSTCTDAPTLEPSALAMIAMGSSVSSEESLRMAANYEASRLSVQETSRGEAEEDEDAERATEKTLLQVQRRQREGADRLADQETLHQAMAANEAEVQRHASEALEYERQLQQAMALSLRDQGRRGSDREWESTSGLDGEEDEELEQARGSTIVQRTTSLDPGHLAGTTQAEFEAQPQQGEKTAQERTEEEIVMKYIKKQSLLEARHQDKGKGRAIATDNDDEEDL
ncbi:hypothetical protein H2200_010978 [Cladophialophora chaetospira]|uniref:Glycosyltransferase family 28 N-terminal domain-containing protein n=1 Tax=Cladophialophora chaetospira TaxID=386627 RepID=A0AA38X134_9EURO|nr:hypothetical protein H2200_010978 [Cladophialophora chaetospira]